MNIKKCIYLTEEEVVEALEQYLSRKDVAYQIEDLIVLVNDNDEFKGIEVIAE